MKIPLDPPLIKGEDKKERSKFPPLKKGGQGGFKELRRVYPEPVEGLAMTKSAFSDFLRDRQWCKGQDRV